MAGAARSDPVDRPRIAKLEERILELEATLDAIRSGEVDAIVVSHGDQSRVYALEGADHPYRALVENIQEGALTLATDGMVLYGNTAFARMCGEQLEQILGRSLCDRIEPRDRPRFDRLLCEAAAVPVRGDIRLRSGSGPVPVRRSRSTRRRSSRSWSPTGGWTTIASSCSPACSTPSRTR